MYVRSVHDVVMLALPISLRRFHTVEKNATQKKKAKEFSGHFLSLSSLVTVFTCREVFIARELPAFLAKRGFKRGVRNNRTHVNVSLCAPTGSRRHVGRSQGRNVRR